MRAGQTMVNDAGVQVALFPLEYLDVSQGEGGSYSHAGTLSIDFLGYENGYRKYKCPYYAPCDCKVVYHANYYNVWQSLKEVITPAGKQYITFVVIHDDNPPSLGTVAHQGELIGHTGTNTSPGGTPVTGDHVHINTANGKYAGWYTVSSGKRQLKNSNHVYSIFYVNDTNIIDGYGYNWREFQGGITPGKYKKFKFKWVLYSKKLRNRNV